MSGTGWDISWVDFVKKLNHLIACSEFWSKRCPPYLYIKPGVSSLPPAACSHICKLCTYQRKVEAVRYTSYCDVYTCGHITSPQQWWWQFVPSLKRLDILALKKITKPVHEETKNCNRSGYDSNHSVSWEQTDSDLPLGCTVGLWLTALIRRFAVTY